MTIKQMSNSTFIPEILKIIDEGHTVTIPLKGNSMRPFLKDGRDKAILVSPKNKKICKGDVVLAEISDKHFVLHRVMDIDNSNVVLLGDGNISKEYCTVVDVKAIATAFYRKGRDKADSVTGKKWKLYSSVWVFLYPVRRYLLFILRHLGY